jgi:hypothetical protein
MRGMVMMGGYDSTREGVKWGVQGGSPCHFLELTYHYHIIFCLTY